MKTKLLTVACITVLPLMSGCLAANLSASKSLVVTLPPGEQKAFVTTEATAKCWDYFLWSRCEMFLDIKQAK